MASIRDFRFENLSRTQQILIFLGLAAAMSVVAYMLLYKGLLEERSVLQADNERLEKKNEEGRAVVAKLNAFKAELKLLEARLAQLRQILPSEKETPTVLKSVQEMAAGSNLRIMKFNPQATVPRAFYSDWPIQVEVDGSYDSLGFFLEKVGGYTRIVNIENLTVTGITGASDQAHTLKAVFTATTFVYRDEPVSPEPKPGAPKQAR